MCYLTKHDGSRASMQFLVCPRGVSAVTRQLWAALEVLWVWDCWGAHSTPEHPPLTGDGGVCWEDEQGAEVETEHSEWILGINISLSIGLEQVALGACPVSVLGAFQEHVGWNPELFALISELPLLGRTLDWASPGAPSILNYPLTLFGYVKI